MLDNFQVLLNLSPSTDLRLRAQYRGSEHEMSCDIVSTGNLLQLALNTARLYLLRSYQREEGQQEMNWSPFLGFYGSLYNL